MCNNTGTPNYRMIEVLIDASQKEYSLKDEEVLDDVKRIIAIEVFKVDNVTVSPSGRPVVNNTVFTKSYLVISTKGSDEVLDEIPFSAMDRNANNGQLFYVNIPPIAPSKCKIIVGSQTGIVAGESFLIGFHYQL